MSKIKFLFILLSVLCLIHICGYAMDMDIDTDKGNEGQEDYLLCAYMDWVEKKLPNQLLDTSVVSPITTSSTRADIKEDTNESDLYAGMDVLEAELFGSSPVTDELQYDLDSAPGVTSVLSSSSSTTTKPVNKKSAVSVDGSMQCYFSSTDNIIAYLISDYIDVAKKNIYIAVYQLRAIEIARALVKAYARGVKVCVICDKSTKDDRAIQLLIQCGIEVFVWYGDTPNALMHHKYALFDDDIVWNGSFNWTHNANDNNCENVMVVKSKEMYKGFYDDFSKILSSPLLQTIPDPNQQNLKKRKRDDTLDGETH